MLRYLHKYSHEEVSMKDIVKKLRYTTTHEWIRIDDDVITVGITDHAQTMLGDLVYIELPELESHLEAGEECAVIESIKAAADVYSPISGEVLEINEALLDNPQLVNEAPYGLGWLFRIKPFEKDFADELLNFVEYQKQVAAEAH
jgi:glycine cleavage system H protein